MKKMVIIGSLALLGTLGLVFGGETTKKVASTSEKNKFVIFGKVDFSDDDDVEDVVSKNSNNQKDDVDDEENGLERFIKTHKTPFSKTIHK
ncbi:hypothetical protein [Streptococcus dysgalactiae]|uniref:hypothetical protein n=1 Tax=Streptococcus dysgalactiae TaxID=1334 RepID=UPI0022B5ED0B|nr:hypothetical protein [Streptococcus dysgalactiae]